MVMKVNDIYYILKGQGHDFFSLAGHGPACLTWIDHF
jgi:hypothetical protein